MLFDLKGGTIVSLVIKKISICSNEVCLTRNTLV